MSMRDHSPCPLQGCDGGGLLAQIERHGHVPLAVGCLIDVAIDLVEKLIVRLARTGLKIVGDGHSDGRGLEAARLNWTLASHQLLCSPGKILRKKGCRPRGHVDRIRIAEVSET